MTQLDHISGVATKVRREGLDTIVRYHNTDVVRFNTKSVVLNHGGWQTNTTKTRMNQASNQYNLGYQVFQKDWAWYIALADGKVIPFDTSKVIIAR